MYYQFNPTFEMSPETYSKVKPLPSETSIAADQKALLRFIP